MPESNGGGYQLTADERRQAIESAAAVRSDLERRHAETEPAETPAARALRRVTAAQNFVTAAREELDDAILEARRVGVPDKQLGGVLGMTAVGAGNRRRVAAQRRLSAPADSE